jgi:hypothetical protein
MLGEKWRAQWGVAKSSAAPLTWKDQR